MILRPRTSVDPRPHKRRGEQAGPHLRRPGHLGETAGACFCSLGLRVLVEGFGCRSSLGFGVWSFSLGFRFTFSSFLQTLHK